MAFELLPQAAAKTAIARPVFYRVARHRRSQSESLARSSRQEKLGEPIGAFFAPAQRVLIPKLTPAAGETLCAGRENHSDE